MLKNRFFRVILVSIVLLLIAAAGIALLLMPKKAAPHPDFSSMPTDTAGNNMIGNLPENLAAGGFMAGQNGWIYFTSFADHGNLYMCRENGADMTKLTDFAVCNINVMGSSVVFTGFDAYTEFESKGSGDKSGKLYAIYGLHSSGKTVFSVIDPDTTYFSPYLDRDGLYVSDSEAAQSALANKINGTHIVIREDMGRLQTQFPFGSMIYAQMSGGRIVRLDAKALFPLDYINGDSLYRIGNRFVFRGEDSFIYELIPADGTINLISAEPVDPFTVNAFGDIVTAPLGNSAGFLIITKNRLYNNFAEMILPKMNPQSITMQNGWYSYKRLDSQQNDDIYFSANGTYYRLNGTKWSADWLNTKLSTEPLVSLDDVIVEDLFTPPWLDFSQDMEPIDPADAGDFGSERPVRPGTDTRADAAHDAKNALDAAILLLSEDARIADRYTGESVEKLRMQYGDAFEAALNDAASKLANTLAADSEISLSPQEAGALLAVWLQDTDYEIGGARVSADGTEATVTLTAKNPVTVQLLSSAIEANGGADLSFADIEREAITDGSVSNAQVYMRLINGDCWIAESPDKLLYSFVLGFDER